MKILIVIACFSIGFLAAKPTHSTVLDLLKDLEHDVEQEGKLIISKVLNVIHHVEDSVLRVKEMVPKVYETIHKEADEILAGLKRVTEEIQEILGKKNVYYGFDLLGGLTELTGGTKLSTVLNVLSLAEKAHKVMSDAKEFVPHLEETLDKMQSRVETHVKDFASHVLKELGLQDVVAKSVMKKIEELFEKVEEEGHALILDLLHKMEQTFTIFEEKLPEIYSEFQKDVDEVKSQIHELIIEIQKSLVMRSFNLLDIAGDMTGGTKMSTVFKVMSLLDKFNTVVQDVKNFEPKAEEFLQHAVKKVAESAQDFFSHAANQLEL